MGQVHHRKSSSTAVARAGATERALMKPSALLTVAQTMHDLQCCRATVYNLIADGELSVVKVAGGTRIKRTNLEAYINRNTIGAKDDAA